MLFTELNSRILTTPDPWSITLTQPEPNLLFQTRIKRSNEDFWLNNGNTLHFKIHYNIKYYDNYKFIIYNSNNTNFFFIWNFM